MMRLIRLVLFLVLVGATLQTSGQNTPGAGISSHQGDFACPVYHGGSFAIAGASYYKLGKQIRHTWWIGWVLRSDQRKSMSFSGRTVTVKIRQRTPYNSWFTAASRKCKA